ncbi:putative WW, C2 and coiled-coil domain containing 1 [Operophtera brumata]|uniref:Putative WW, C2 and coiled-coil domain containing 1 n=1 Tax=Operophtera brumata TaxID=104452 RepID=A0A0L7KRE7_OPEBR|nr:putative WW, C2 and coiled-coil domain containing 1 [Operophtera brumata]
MISRAEGADEVTGPVSVGPRRHLGGPRGSIRRTYYDRRLEPGRRERPYPCGEIDLQNAPEIAFFRRCGRIPPRAI